MSAKSTLPAYVVSALQADRRQQITTLATVVVYLADEIKAEREVTGTGEKFHKVSPHRSLKTWQNYASAASAVARASACAVKLDSLSAEHTAPADRVPAFAHWLERELKAKGHSMEVDDVARFAKGKPSVKAQLQAAAEAQKAIEVAEAQAQAQAAAEGKTVEQVAEEQKRASMEETKRAQVEATEATTESAPQPPAVQGPMVAPLLIVRRNKEGLLDIDMGPDLTPDEMLAIIEGLQAQYDAATVAQAVAA